MYSQICRIFFILAVLFVSKIYAIPRSRPKTICNSDEIGIGASENLIVKYHGSSIEGDGHFGAIFAHDCQILDLSTYGDPFGGQWHKYYSVSSTNDYGPHPFPLEVRTPYGIYKNCMELSGSRNCDSDGEDYHLLSPVTHCCKYIGPNEDVPNDSNDDMLQVGDLGS